MKRTKEYTVLVIPTSDWELLKETLEADSRSGAFDADLREEIESSLDEVREVGLTTRPIKVQNAVKPLLKTA